MQLRSLVTDAFCCVTRASRVSLEANPSFIETASHFLQALVRNTSLKRLEFVDSRCFIVIFFSSTLARSQFVFHHVAKVLARNHTLVKLVAKSNLGLGELPYPEFLEYIKDNRSIQYDSIFLLCAYFQSCW